MKQVFRNAVNSAEKPSDPRYPLILIYLQHPHTYIKSLLVQELIRRWDSERELLRSAPRKLPNSLK